MKLIADCERDLSRLKPASRSQAQGCSTSGLMRSRDSITRTEAEQIGAQNRARQRLDREALQRNHQVGDRSVRRMKAALALRFFANGHQQAIVGDEFDCGQCSLCRLPFRFLHRHRGHTHYGVAARRSTDRCGARVSFTGARFSGVIAAGAALATASFCMAAGAIRRFSRDYVPPAKEFVVTVGTNATRPRECAQCERH